ncbi:MAG: 2-oxo acid dehydrogenase subunit E2 [Christensenellales bacterium]
MCKKRSDGVKIKHCDPILRMTSYIMPHRYDAQVFSKDKIKCEGIDRFIREEAEKGEKFSYMHVVIAGLVRMYALRPKLNRFVMNRKIFARNNISICFAMKKQLTEDAPETTIKLEFSGKENIYEIRDAIEKAIEENKHVSESNDTDKAAKALLKLPNWLLKTAMRFISWMDKHGLLPKKLIKVSPFHTTCFLSNMKSLRTDYIYHHLYDFGTTGQFIGMGKDHVEPVVDDDGLVTTQKVMKLGLVIDERLCDGFYYAKAIKYGTKFIENPELLRESLEEIVVDDEI